MAHNKSAITGTWIAMWILQQKINCGYVFLTARNPDVRWVTSPQCTRP